ncbi:MAG: response regulator transcription factor [Pseudomonadota bacterium]
MKRYRNTVWVTHDVGLLSHWQKALGTSKQTVATRMGDFFQLHPAGLCIAWIDLSIAGRPAWTAEAWRGILQSEHIRVVAASSNPNDDEAMQALDAGCAAYCHAFSDAATLKQVAEVVDAGNVWIGKNLMQRLLQGVNRAATVPSAQAKADGVWREGLTQRELEVAVLAANGASNHAISTQCKITERTVKAHLSAVFQKLNITDRLQLALRVHGIH